MDVRELTCEHCGVAFGCEAGAPSGCWCMRMVIEKADLQALRERFVDCLCPACLQSLASAGNPPPPP